MNKKKIIYISDFFVGEILGGAELSDNVVINYLTAEGYEVQKIKSRRFSPNFVDGEFFVISNFSLLSETNKQYFIKDLKGKYIIIERDQKYVRSRNTANYKDYVAPQSQVVNREFYENAKKVFCLTSKQMEIMKRHIDLKNVESLGCTQFSKEQLQILEDNIGNEKKSNQQIYAIVSGKRSGQAVALCQSEGLKYDVLNKMPYKDFIGCLSRYDGIVFFSHAFESCCRLLIEARILNLKIITDDKNGCTYEPWFNQYKGEELLRFIKTKTLSTMVSVKEEIEC